MTDPPLALETPDTSTAIAGVETPDDLLARLASELFDPLAPASCVALGSTCRGIRSALTSVLEALRQSRRSAEQLTRRLAPQTGLFPTKCWRLQLMQELNLNHLRVAEMADFGELIVRSSPAEHSRALAPPANPARSLHLKANRSLPLLTRLLASNNTSGGTLPLLRSLGAGDLPSLGFLTLNDPGVQPGAVGEALASALRANPSCLPSLSILSLSNSNLQCDGARHLVSLLAEPRLLPSLTDLILRKNRIGSAGIRLVLLTMGEEAESRRSERDASVFQRLELLDLQDNPGNAVLRAKDVQVGACTVRFVAREGEEEEEDEAPPADDDSEDDGEGDFDDDAEEDDEDML